MCTLLYIFSVRNAIKRKKDLFSLKRSATCAMAKNNLLKRFATSARAEVAQLELCASNCGMPPLSVYLLKNLSGVLHAAVRFIFNLHGSSRRIPISPYLKSVHILPIKFPSMFKIALLTYKCFLLQLRWLSGKSVSLVNCRLEFDSESGQTNDFKIGIHSFPV